MRRDLVALIDADKATAYFQATQGWSAEETRQQVLTPIEESTIRGTTHADPKSIMCYQIPSECTKDGQPIIGGLDIDASDYIFAAQLYPKPHHIAHHAEETLSALTQDTAVIDIANGEITRITLKRPVTSDLGV